MEQKLHLNKLKGLLRAAYTDLKRNTNDFQGLDAVTPPIK